MLEPIYVGIKMAGDRQTIRNSGACMIKPVVSAVVPSYRHGAFIAERLESILTQSLSDLELIVIDDCSPDESDTVIGSLQKKHDFVYIRNDRNSGTPFSAWERAAAIGKGK